MFKIQNLSKQYGNTFALNNVSMEIGSGLNFIMGSSGSGKTSLLKIISAMDQEYEGIVEYKGLNLKDLTSKEKSQYYNEVFGFVWQEAHLIDDKTVLENILLPQYLKTNDNEKIALRYLKDFGLLSLKDKKARLLSGGEKQRVAIVRELIKNPQVIVADEPTSALDKESSKIVMDLLRKISKSKTVIIVTHDHSLVNKNDAVYELDKGELINESTIKTSKYKSFTLNSSLSTKNMFKVSIENIKTKPFQFFLSCLVMLVSTSLLISGLSGMVGDKTEEAFNTLYKNYGESLTDIMLATQFTGAAGTSDNDESMPNGEVIQNVGDLLNFYSQDDRISSIAYLVPYSGIKIEYEKQTFSVEQSTSMPTLKEILAGKLPSLQEGGVVVPKGVPEQMGLTNEEAIGKEITFSAEAKNKKISITTQIVGVMETEVYIENDGEPFTFDIPDNFLFSKSDLEKMGISTENLNFVMRPDSPQSMIEIRDELSSKGFVPLGYFELVEDLVRLSNQTGTQSKTASILLSSIGILVALSLNFIIASTKKKDFAVYKSLGYSNKDLIMIESTESIIASIISLILLMFMFKQNIMSLLVILGIGIIMTSINISTTSITKSFKVGNQI